MNIGNNVAHTIAGFVERIINLEDARQRLKDERKQEAEFFRDHQLPGAELVRLAKADAEKLDDAAERLRRAGSILGVSVYGEIVEPKDPGIADSLVEGAKETVQNILRLDEEIKSINEDLKELKKEVKAAGLQYRIIEKLVAYKRNPDTFREDSLLFDAYKQALESVA